MRTNRTGYLMAMLAGLAIVGASTGGVVAATSHHNTTLAAAQVAQIPAATAPDSSPAPSTAAPDASPGLASRAPDSQAGAPASSAASVGRTAGPVTTSLKTTSPTTTSATTTSQTTASSAAGASRRTTTPSKATTTIPTTAATTSSKVVTPTPVAAARKYKDGQYTATGSYNSPGGTEKLGVTITLASDKVVRSALDLLGGAGLSHSFQTAFESGYAPQVIGKDIDSISLGAVSGSSLTGMGFNDALKQIESQAKT